MDLGLNGRKVIVTGGGKGIGRWITETFLDEGAEVAICGRDGDTIATAVDELSPKGKVFGQACDVTDAEKFPAFIESAAQQLGGLDTLVLNASIQPSGDDDATWELTFQSDVMQAVRGIRAARAHLAASDAPSVVIICSTTALSPTTGPGQTAYGTVKAALLSYSSKMAATLGADGIRVNTIIPGVIAFPGGVWGNMQQTMPQITESIAKSSHLGRLGEAQEVANAVAFLASPRASFITGSALRVDGGMTKGVNF